MFHGFDYPDETGKNEFWSRFWTPRMRSGVIGFDRPEECRVRKFIREMHAKRFVPGANLSTLKEEVLPR
jgi:CRISPR-associated protein Cas5d